VGTPEPEYRHASPACAIGDIVPLKNLKPFNGLSVITSEMDEIEVGHLLKATEDLGLVCQECGSRRFEVEGFIPIKAEILTGKHILLAHVDYEEVLVNRVAKCAHCSSTDFVMITEEKHNGQK
jgi:DNA-directed RNA polymerase subunit RPC12/RpoP